MPHRCWQWCLWWAGHEPRMSSELMGYEMLPRGNVWGGQAGEGERALHHPTKSSLVFQEDQKSFQQACDSTELPLSLP